MTLSIDTKLVHSGEIRVMGAVTMPIFQSVTYEFDEVESYDEVRYSRLNNTPTHDALHTKLAALFGTEAALATASGMAAITTALLGTLETGDHVISQQNLYGGTLGLLGELQRFGIEVDFAGSAADLPELLRENTRLIYLESISNPTMRVGWIPAAVEFARDHGLLTAVDNTFATPINFRPSEVGVDLVIHSATKYLNGHSDVAAGAVGASKKLIEQLRTRMNLYGPTLDPNAAWLLQRGLKTLALRVARQNETAMELARWFEQYDRVDHVLYPGLESHPDHSRAVQMMSHFGGMLSIVLKDAESARHFCHTLQLATEAPSLGGVESLVTRPATTSHKGLSPVELKKAGIHPGMVRISVGIESLDDLRDDFDKALSGC